MSYDSKNTQKPTKEQNDKGSTTQAPYTKDTGFNKDKDRPQKPTGGSGSFSGGKS